MITPKDIFKKTENKISEVLIAWLEDRSYFPLIVRSDKTLTASNFETLHKELGLLLKSSKDVKGYGYRVELKEVNTRKLGRQKLPEAIVFDEALDFWKFIGKEIQWERFQQDAGLIKNELPQLESWLRMNPLKVIMNEGKWLGLLSVCKYFIENTQPNCYLREIPAQPHTKFIEENKGIIESLLTELIGDFMFKEGSSFEERFHLKLYERLIQIRLLDQSLTKYFSGVSHIGITIPDLATLVLPCKKVIIMENKASYSNIENFLTLPQLRDTLVVFGSGYAVKDLKNVKWLNEKEMYYWGDIDEHGFQILHQLRNYYPATKSLLMDMETYTAFEKLAVSASPAAVGDLTLLNSDEMELLKRLRLNPLKNRLEQERIPQQHIVNVLQRNWNYSSGDQ